MENFIHSVIRVRFFLVIVLSLGMGISACNEKKIISDSDKAPLALRDEVKLLTEEIARDNYIGTEQVSRKPVTDPAYNRRLKLMRIATDEELLALTGNPNAVVSLIAFEGLYNRGNSTVPAIFNAFRERSDMITYLRGDLMMEMPMLEYAYVFVMNYDLPNEEGEAELEKAEPKFPLSEDERKAVVERIDGLRADEK